jgi:hypothetical protein
MFINAEADKAVGVVYSSLVMSTATQPVPDSSGTHPRPLTVSAVAAVQCFFFLTAWALNAFVLRRSLRALLETGTSVPVQLLVGIAVGAVLAIGVAYPIITLRTFQGVRELIRQVAVNLSSSVKSIMIASLLTGVGEEILFRGTFQVWVGFWWAVLLFVLAHLPHIVPRPLGIGPLSYLSFVFLMGILLGSLFIHFGLIGAATAHAVFDAGLLFSFRRHINRKNQYIV